MKFVQDNAAVPFYLVVDAFDPHEPWEAPEEYYRMYADGSYKNKRIIHTAYRRDLAGLTEEQLADVVAHYSGLVTLVDEWFGRLLARLDEAGLAEKTLVMFLSDHGTNFGDNLWRVVGKPDWALLPGVMDLPLIVRTPDGAAAGRRLGGLRYNIDVSATVYDAAGVRPSQPIDGKSLLPLLRGDPGGNRPYVTSLYGGTWWYFDGTWWAFGNIRGDQRHVFNVPADPSFRRDLAEPGNEEAAAIAALEKVVRPRVLADAGGDLPDYSGRKATDAIGQTPVK
jgi:arylsulfatase A-like enzyme